MARLHRAHARRQCRGNRQIADAGAQGRLHEGRARLRVSTYIASGNVVFETDKSAPAVKLLLTELLRDRFGLTRNHTLIRTPQSLAAVIAGNPFAAAAAERPNWLMVNFLDGLPPAGCR